MNHHRSPVAQLLRHITRQAALPLALALAGTAVLADDYSDTLGLLRAGKLPQAQARAEQYLATKPRDAQMQFLLGTIQQSAGKTAEALVIFTKMVEDFPELPEPYNNLAVIYAAQNQYDKARTALEMAIRTKPDYTIAHENLGDVYAKLASQHYGKALSLDTANNGVALKLATVRDLFAARAASPKAAGASDKATASPAAASTAK